MPQLSRKNAIRWLRSDETYASTLLCLCRALYDLEFLQWTGETISEALREDLGVPPTDDNLDRIMAGIAILTTDEFWTLTPRFIDLANALGRDGFDPRVFDPAEVHECAWALLEAELLDPEHPPLSPDILGYLQAILTHEGYVSVPKSLARFGLHMPDLADTFADDPELFAGVYELQHERTETLDRGVQEQLLDLMAQLQSLSPDDPSMVEAVRNTVRDISSRHAA